MKAQKDGGPPGSHNIDELFSSTLGKLRKQPSPAVWENIAGNLPPSSLSTRGLTNGINKWLFIGLAGAVITAAVLLFLNRPSETQKSTSVPTFLHKQHDSIDSKVKADHTVNKNGKNAIAESSPLHSVPVIPVQSNEHSSHSNPWHTPVTKEIKDQTTTSNENLNRNTNTAVNVKKSTDVSDSSDIMMFEPATILRSSISVIPESTMKLNSPGPEKNKSLTTSYDSLINLSTFSEKPESAGSTAQSASQKKESLIASPPTPITNTTIQAKATSLAFSLEIYAEPVISGQLLKARSSDAGALLDYRKRNENSFSGTNWGFEGRISHKKLFAQTGIRYSVFGSNANYPFSTTLLDSTRSHFEVNIQNKWEYNTVWVWTENSGVIYYVPAQDSNLIQQIDSTWKLLIDTAYNKRNEKSQIRFRYMEIPFLIGYQLGKRKLETEFSGGFALGFLSGKKGDIINTDLNASIPANQVHIPFNKPLLSLLLRIGCSYHVNENWGIFTRSAFRYTPQSSFGSDYPLYQRNYSIGLQFGIKYSF
jgi:hypothetical protein